jgi:DNA polymerase-3 subunit alpha
MKIVYIYCQTNGLHQTNEDVIKKNLFEFARLVSINYEIESNDKMSSDNKNVNIIIKPRCMFIDEDTIKIHGITNEIAKEKGIEIEDVLKKFKEDLKDVDIIVTHNQSFHLKTIMAEFVRYNIPFSFEKYKKIDLSNYNHEFKFPKLNFLYNKFYSDSSNISEVEKIKKIYIKLVK